MLGWRAFLVGLISLAVNPAMADGRLAFWQSRDSNYNNTAFTAGGYVGPGDIVASATAWYGLRAYNAAYAAPGTNKAVNLRRASDNAACDFVIAATGALGGTAGACAQGGGLSLAAFATSDATASCTIATTTATCTGASSTPHVGSTITGAGVTQPCYASAVGTFTGGAGTVTVAGGTGASPCGTIGGATTLTYTYGLYTTKWYDQSGALSCTSASCDAAQATAGNQPQLLPSCISGLPCVNFIASSSMQLSTTSGPTLAQPISMSAVFNIQVAALGRVFGNSNTSAPSFGASATSGNCEMGGSGGGAVQNTGCTLGTAFSVQGIANAASSAVVVNNSSTTGSQTGTFSGVFSLGSQTGSIFFTGFVGTIGDWAVAFNSAQYGNLCHNDRLFYTLGGSC